MRAQQSNSARHEIFYVE